MICKVGSISAARDFLITLRKVGVKNLDRVSITRHMLNKHSQHVKFVCVVGSRPSTASPDNTPFHPTTRSRKIIDSWFINDDRRYIIEYCNIIDTPKIKNGKSTAKEIKDNIGNIMCKINPFAVSHSVVAVGKEAEYALSLLDGVEYYSMPHPSGLNRIWNDKEKSKELIGGMLKWINNG